MKIILAEIEGPDKVLKNTHKKVIKKQFCEFDRIHLEVQIHLQQPPQNWLHATTAYYYIHIQKNRFRAVGRSRDPVSSTPSRKTPQVRRTCLLFLRREITKAFRVRRSSLVCSKLSLKLWFNFFIRSDSCEFFTVNSLKLQPPDRWSKWWDLWHKQHTI